jgi:DNA-binding MarR family transcriptional regulator
LIVMPRPSPTKPTVGTALRLTYRAFARDLARRLAPHGVTLLMWFVLRQLWKRDGLSQAEIAGATDRQASAIVSVVRSLQAAGLVRVTRSVRDGRRSVVRLTRAGRKLEPVLTAHGKNLSQTAQRGFTAAEKRALMDMLARLRRNIGNNNGENGAFSGEVVTGSPQKMRPKRK